jgi:chemotaxis protein CheC
VNEQGIWDSVTGGSHTRLWLDMAMKRVVQALSDTVGQPIYYSALRAETAPVAELVERIGEPEAKTVGVQLQIKGDARGQALLLFSWESALRLVDLLMEVPPGTTVNVGFAERTALAEIGNLALAHFLNALVAYSQLPRRLQPSPSNVLVDALETILRLALMPVTIAGDDPLVIEAMFSNVAGTAQIHFLVLPEQIGRQRPDMFTTKSPGGRASRRA